MELRGYKVNELTDAWLPIGTVNSQTGAILKSMGGDATWILEDGTLYPTYQQVRDIPNGAKLGLGGVWVHPSIPPSVRLGTANEDFVSSAKPSSQPYRCLTCQNTNLDSRDMEVNPATGNIWGCNKCGGKKLERVGEKSPMAKKPTEGLRNLTEEMLLDAYNKLSYHPKAKP